MERKWDQARLEQLKRDSIEESLTLDYKSAAALGRSDSKKREITKDVSAMANSAGGTIIYGMKEDGHKPESVDPIDRDSFSAEWLQQVINNIRPHIDVRIEPVEIDGDASKAVYVVEIQQSTTAHQAQDLRYYKRFNRLSQPMHDYEIRDVMNRATAPVLDVEFRIRSAGKVGRYPETYEIWPTIRNQGPQLVQHLQLVYTCPLVVISRWVRAEGAQFEFRVVEGHEHRPYVRVVGNLVEVTYRSPGVLFPCDEISPINFTKLRYAFRCESLLPEEREKLTVNWKLWADSMSPPKTGKVSIPQFHNW